MFRAQTNERISFGEACEFAGHVETIAQLHLNMGKMEALWLMTSKSVARALDFDAKVVGLEKVRLLAAQLEAKNERHMREADGETLPDEDWTRMKLPTSLGEMGIRAVTSQLEVSFGVTEKKSRAQAVRIEKGKNENSLNAVLSESQAVRESESQSERESKSKSKKQEARSKKQEARSKKQEARSKKQEARSKKQEARSKRRRRRRRKRKRKRR